LSTTNKQEQGKARKWQLVKQDIFSEPRQKKKLTVFSIPRRYFSLSLEFLPLFSFIVIIFIIIRLAVLFLGRLAF
jgi:hypothetical protein